MTPKQEKVMKIIDYCVVTDGSVKAYLGDGWKLYGNPMVISEPREINYGQPYYETTIFQAIVKYQEE